MFPVSWTGEQDLASMFPQVLVRQLVSSRLDWTLIRKFLELYGPFQSVRIAKVSRWEEVKQAEQLTSETKLLQMELEQPCNCTLSQTGCTLVDDTISYMSKKSRLLYYFERLMMSNATANVCNFFLVFKSEK